MRDIEFGYSILSTAYDCQYKFKLKYLDKLESTQDKGIDLEFGTAIHAAIAASFEGIDPTTVFRIHWGSIKDRPLKSYRYNYDMLSGIGDRLLSKWSRLHSSHYKPLHVEKKLQWELGGFKMQGTPDFIGEYKGVLSIVDWKTSNMKYDRRKLEADEQMPLYAYAAKKALGLDIKQVVYAPLIKGTESVQTPLVLPISQKDVEKKLDNVIDHMRFLASTETFIKNRKHCGLCDYWDQCEGKDA